jgi:hypothetical protein
MRTHPDSLSAELREVEHEHPGWHAWLSDEGRAYAVTTHGTNPAGGVTLSAPTPELLDHEVAVWEHQHRGRAA